MKKKWRQLASWNAVVKHYRFVSCVFCWRPCSPQGRKALMSEPLYSSTMWSQSGRLVHAHVCMSIIQREDHHLSRCDVKRKIVLWEQLKPAHCWCLLTRWGGREGGRGRCVGLGGPGGQRTRSWWAGCWLVGHRCHWHGLQVLESSEWSWRKNLALSLESVGGRDLWETRQKMTTRNLIRVDQTWCTTCLSGWSASSVFNFFALPQ